MLPWPITPIKLGRISTATHLPQGSVHAIQKNLSSPYSKNKPKHLINSEMAITSWFSGFGPLLEACILYLRVLPLAPVLVL